MAGALERVKELTRDWFERHERDAQALVVGAHGHGTLSEVLLGSTSRKVIRTAPCPVLVSPAARTGTASEESAEEAAAASR